MTTKKITFKCNGLGREAKIMLFFMSRRLMNSAELSVPTQSPVAWKVIRFAPYGESEATVTWTDTLGVCVARVGHNSIVTAEAYTPIKIGQTTSLLRTDPRGDQPDTWTDPVFTPGVTTAKAVNETGQQVDIGIGFFSSIATKEEFNLAMVCRNVPDKQAIDETLPPTLCITAGDHAYEEGELIPHGIREIPGRTWLHNVTSLKEETSFTITEGCQGEIIPIPSEEAAIPIGEGARVDERIPIGGGARIDESIPIGGGARIDETIPIGGGARIDETIPIGGGARIDERVPIGGGARIDETIPIGGGASIIETIPIGGGARIDETIPIGGGARVDERIPIGGGARIDETIPIGGGASIIETIPIGGGARIDETIPIGEGARIDERIPIDGAAVANETANFSAGLFGPVLGSMIPPGRLPFKPF